MLFRRALAASLCVVALSCRSEAPTPRVQVAAEAAAIDATTVEIVFTHELDAARFDPSALSISAPFERNSEPLAIGEARVEGATLRLTTAPQKGGALYAVALGALAFVGLDEIDAPSQVNFTGYGRTTVVVTLETDGFFVPAGVDALVTVDLATSEYSPALQRVAMVEDPAGTFTATFSARIEPERLHAVRAVTSEGAEAAQLTTFSVKSDDPVLVGLVPLLDPLPEFDAPVDPTPGDGRAPVRLVFDDRPARALSRPSVRLSLDPQGAFDAGSTRIEPLALVAGETRVYEKIIEVAVDPNRTLDGTRADTFPYVAFLVEDGEDVPQRGTTFVMPEERPQVIVIPIGNPAMVPVTFRVDAGDAFVTPDGATRERYAGEGIFLTGELPSAEDGLGRLAADAFTGGERATLEMRERPDAPGVFERTIFLPKNRPYGWKVVRCPAGRGCAELNRHVVSSGRAFPTVMKNLVTINEDAAQLDQVQLVDPANLDRVPTAGGQTADYSNARVSQDGTESESPAIMFKQEAPDLVVTVGEAPVVTPIYVVGTWRDVNIPDTPAEIIATGGTLELTPFDYDDGTQGRAPIVRDLELPLDPPPAMLQPGEPTFAPTDGRRDGVAANLLDGALAARYNETALYVSVAAATPGVDRFVVVSFDEPTTMRAAHWSKSGRVAASARQVFLAMEGDGDFASWFSWTATPQNDAQLTTGTASGHQDVLEGTIDPVAAGVGAFGDRVWIAVLTYATNDGGELAMQSPSGNRDLDVDAAEFVEIPLDSIR